MQICSFHCTSKS